MYLRSSDAVVSAAIEITAVDEFEAQAAAADFMTNIFCQRCQGMKYSGGSGVDQWSGDQCACVECVDCGDEFGEDEICEINGDSVCHTCRPRGENAKEESESGELVRTENQSERSQ